ncbi:MAG: hypothetical protein N4A46_07090 [Schleiferiaceae bacterium]|jgi:hypothetical protein|nr:hypothetical protein [Schleiferiaceae bacterium]
MDLKYPEIEKLNEVFIKHKAFTKIDRRFTLAGDEYYPKVHFELSGTHFEIYVDDEYDDLRKNYPLLNLCLVLRELEGFDYSRNYEVWCQERYKEIKNPQVKANFDHLEEVYNSVEKILGKIDSFVTDFDFEMNAGAAQALRRDKD